MKKEMKTQIEEAETPNADDKLKISPDLTFEPRQNNNHYVVPVGLLIVLVTIYLMVEGLQLNYKRFSESSVAATKLNTIQNEAMAPQMLPTCIELDIFTEQQDDKSLSFSNARNQLMKPNPQSKATKRKAQNGNAGSKLSKVPRMNKQLEMSNKKDSPKKSNTAEPIIYLFALVFIYLLLKAASDINQHYKSQNKGDKRLRRCSLQSYAQAHKDRRASKGISPKSFPKF
ncbi:uncharacterized protein LOC115631272 [Scaptodrosophila lebanonensis]|uniref:Uncharacterized protein LOC115631272 n=1 Tax=Drosophila lebanonensis TaxID=7225 RepID=A0A6J2U9J4_DROLE|nr:uncharacterized protein LOC115631272 [Scaptodrosophila lebanonensis]